MPDPRTPSVPRGWFARILRAPGKLLLSLGWERRAGLEAHLRQQIKDADLERATGVAAMVGRCSLIER